MKLNNQRRIAADVLKKGTKKVKFNITRLADIKEAITRADIRSLIIDNAISADPKRGVSRGRVRKSLVQKRKGRQSGAGSRKGVKTARLPKKLNWMNHVRKQRKFIKELRDKKLITTIVYREMYNKVKGGFFRSKNHIKIYLTENRLFEDVKK
ncbi:50S ribosomal protein L19e [Candidatus Woesearchaeota archaeon]|jgi:large subunit ribosomal protein L19e|nr:50S ribosomal protein L19e [Candidatus Woesearchaeota archaeon]MBT4835216.1 50S ribosomal protein L19e [Candidatus Woesearchaeota archaeon]MBT6734909.1 50S ribosomal protein L19e [Candidatus Woesearchaeota archaeon]MBT7169576.1 50S ribosomal protein L19e [Candidatus Woesearchaeota archaeon]MBT7474534.1 50S ribosomal protein L19e [Candidatus Woesearchaeota archaeon]